MATEHKLNFELVIHSVSDTVHDLILKVQYPYRSIWTGTTPSAKRYDFFITDMHGAELWRWSKGMMFAQMITHIEIPGAEFMIFAKERWDNSQQKINGMVKVHAEFIATKTLITKEISL